MTSWWSCMPLPCSSNFWMESLIGLMRIIRGDQSYPMRIIIGDHSFPITSHSCSFRRLHCFKSLRKWDWHRGSLNATKIHRLTFVLDYSCKVWDSRPM
jgi:hypothetical protein